MYTLKRDFIYHKEHAIQTDTRDKDKKAKSMPPLYSQGDAEKSIDSRCAEKPSENYSKPEEEQPFIIVSAKASLTQNIIRNNSLFRCTVL